MSDSRQQSWCKQRHPPESVVRCADKNSLRPCSIALTTLPLLYAAALVRDSQQQFSAFSAGYQLSSSFSAHG